MVQPRVRRTTDALPRKKAMPAEVLAALPRPRIADSPNLPIPSPRPAPEPAPDEPRSRGGDPYPKAPAPVSEEARGGLQRLWRGITGLLLIAAMVGSVTAMVTVMTQHLGFAPVLSPSMEPTFHPGDLVVTKPEPVADIKVGQIIALPIPGSPGQHYVHRIISVTTKDGKPLVQTRGDANPKPEPFTLRIDSPTVPRVVSVVPYVGRVSVLLQHSKTRLTVMAVTIFAILLAAWRLVAGARSGRPKQPPRPVGRHRAIDATTVAG